MVAVDRDFAWMPQADVVAWDRNPRINDASVEPVALSIARFGFVAPVVLWKGGNRLVAGHTRLRAVEFLQSNRPVYNDGQFARWEARPADDPFHVIAGFGEDGDAVLAPSADAVPVRFQDFTSEQEADAYALADNKLAELADWDEAELARIMVDIDADGLGWSVEELKELHANSEYLDGLSPPPPIDPVVPSRVLQFDLSLDDYNEVIAILLDVREQQQGDLSYSDALLWVMRKSRDGQ